MRYSVTFTVAAALSSACVLAAPAPAPAEKAEPNFSVPVLPRANYKPNGRAALAKALKKYGLKTAFPWDAHSGAKEKRQNSEVTATPDQYDEEYTCPVKIGTPPQTLYLDFDTGSSDLWVFSTEQPAKQRTGHDVFNSATSTTFKRNSSYTSWSISYADGSGASGDCGTDTVTVGGTTVVGQVVELAKTASSSFTSGDNDGLLGLAFSTINTVRPKQAKTFFDNAKGSLTSPLFTAYLRHQQPGAYDFGYIDNTKHTGTIVYTNVITSNGFWEFPSTSYKLGTSSTVHTQSGTGIADTGTTLLLVSSSAAAAYYAQIPGAQANQQIGAYIYPCTANPPAFSFAVGSNYATVSGQNINFEPNVASSGTTEYCYGAIQPISGTMYIYGDIFFKQNFVVFNYGASTAEPPTTATLGFAPHVYP